MSLFCNSPTPPSGSLVSKIAPGVLSFLYPVNYLRSSRARIVHPRIPTERLEAWFVKSLTRAGQCFHHSPRINLHCPSLISKRPHVAARRLKYSVEAFHRQQHTMVENHTREELLALIDGYDGDYFTHEPPMRELPPRYQPPDGPHITVSDKLEDEWPPPHHAWHADLHTEVKLENLEVALKDFSKDAEEIFRLYRELPEPRVPYLESQTRHKLLRHLSVVKHKDEHSMLRYFSVVDDMKRTAIPLSTAEWTSAISFAARYVEKSTEVEVEAALRMWAEMEQIAGVKGNSATFHVLFDVACKAGKFTLAERIYKEMESRGLENNRFHHVSLIQYCGLRADGVGVRAAFRELIKAGEIVDTVVLNAMISALIKAHEPSFAEHIYAWMKTRHLERSGSQLPPRDYKDKRRINSVLMKLARAAKHNPARHVELEQQTIVAPDMQTYRILVYHFAVQTGELHKAVQYIDEMKWFQLPLHGAIFLSLMKGFAIHGGIRYTHWTEDRLERVWKAFLRAIDSGAEDLYISKWIVTWALRAFSTCSGKSRMVDAWEEVKQKWNPDEADLSFVMTTLQPLLDGEDMLNKRNDWLLGSL